MKTLHGTALTSIAHAPVQSLNSAPFLIEKAPLRSYWEDSSTHGIEEVCAALARIKTIFRCLGYPPPGRALLVGSESDVGASRASTEFLGNLLVLMEREPSLRPYLDAHRGKPEENSPDPLAAWAAASGDVAFLIALKERGWEPVVARYIDLLKTFVVPAILIGLTAILGNYIATDLQRKAFKHQKTFDVRLEGLQKGQERAAELYTSINDAYSTIADAEENKFTGLTTNKLRGERQKLDSIHAASRLYDSDGTVGRVMLDAEVLLDQYIECLDRKHEQEKVDAVNAASINCSKQSENILVEFDKILDAHTIAMAKLASSEP